MKLGSVFAVALLALTAVLPAQGFSSTPLEEGWNTLHQQDTAERRKKRVKGGSGCDDPGDAAEHPECR